jgi:hypothetical protein
MQLLFFCARKRINQFCLSLFDSNKQKSNFVRSLFYKFLVESVFYKLCTPVKLNCTAFFFKFLDFFKKIGTCSRRLACVVSTISLAKSSFSKLVKPIWNKKKQSTTKIVSFDKYKVLGVSYYNIRFKSAVKAHHYKLWINFVRLPKKTLCNCYFS